MVKTISKGNGDWRPWWVGWKVMCKECGRIVELEDGDENLANWMPMVDDGVAIRCERCGNTVTLKKPPKTATRTFKTGGKEEPTCESGQ